jgi:hypothetical protein
MEGARIDPNMGAELAQLVASPIAQISLDISEQPAVALPGMVYSTSVSLSSPPLRV